MLDIVHIFNFFERHRSAAVDVKIRLQLPVPRVGHEIQPVEAQSRAVTAKLRVLAVHSGIPKMLRVGDADEWNLIELMLDRPHHVVHGGFDDEIHPAVG